MPADYSWAAADWCAWFDERAGIAEFDGGLRREAAERQAFESCIVEWQRQNPVKVSPSICAGCGAGATADAPLALSRVQPAPLHVECAQDWHEKWRAQAIKSLAKFGIVPVAVKRSQNDAP